MRREGAHRAAGQEIRLSAADPLNLVGVILPGSRVPSSPSNFVVFRDGVPVRSETDSTPIEFVTTNVS
jgi:ATP-dependent Lhr-like helicase